MILRIDIYEPVTEEQVRMIKASLAEMGCKDITVEKIPETDQEEEDEYAPPTEPEDGDWVTDDYVHWYPFDGPLSLLTVTNPNRWPEEMKAKMERDQRWPNLWYQGERGDWNLLDIHKGTFA
jgi:hypothetical protein